MRDALLDGELLAIDPDGHPNFRLLMRGHGDLHCTAVDLLWLNGRDLRIKALAERKRRLERLIPESGSLLSRVFTVPEDGRALFEAVQRLDLDGIVAKRKRDPYAAGVTWLKIKNRLSSQMEGRGDLFHPR